MAAPIDPAPATPFAPRSPRQALLVIHGIGEQNPYETLDGFARGTFTYFSKHMNAKLCPIEIAHKEWTQVGMRINLFDRAPGSAPIPPKDLPPCPETPPDPTGQTVDAPVANVDIFEYYWAPETEDKLNAKDTLTWVLKTDFTPLRYFADNLQEMIGDPAMKFWPTVWSAIKLYVREILRVFILYAGLAVGVVLLMKWLARNHNWTAALKNLATALLPYLGWKPCIALALYAAFLLMAWFALQSLIEMYQQPGTSLQKIPERLWFALDILGAAALLAAAITLERRSGNNILEQLWPIVRRNDNWQPLAGAAIALVVSYFLTAYVADIAVYVNTDAKSKDYLARNAILKDSTAALKDLLTCGSYDRVILAGHSLGSVIAYDTINEILAEFNAASGPASDRPDLPLNLAQLQTLKGLVTFGSPLDKVYYFFREHVKRDQAIRAQILSMLHSFRVKHSGREYGEFAFTYAFKQLDGLRWLNAWSPADPVSGNLKFYVPDSQRAFHYAVPVLAHLSYWSDPNFYDYFCTSLL